MLTLKEISESLSMPFEGDGSLLISGPSEPKSATKNQLALAMSNSFLEDLKIGAARAALLIEGTNWMEYGLDGALFIKRPRYAVAQINSLFEESFVEWCGIHKSAVISNHSKVSDDVSIGPFSVISS